MGQGGLGQHHPADDVGVKDSDQIVFLELRERPSIHVPRVVDQHVESASTVLDCGVDHGFAVGGTSDVSNHSVAAVADRRRHLVHLVPASTRDRDSRPVCTEVTGDALTYTGPPTGDQHRHGFQRPHEPTSDAPWPTESTEAGRGR